MSVSVSHILPEHSLPSTGYPVSRSCEWFGGDDAVGYRLRGGHPTYGEHDIEYRFNRLGYRCADFDAAADIRILAIGCSYVLGIGVAQEHLFHERFGSRLASELSKKVVVWNLGRAGASNDYISRMLLLAVPALDPHVVLLNFTHLTRREYLSLQNRHINYNPRFDPTDDITRDIFGHFAALCSPFDDVLNLFKNYKLIELLLSGRRWLYSEIRPEDSDPIASHMQRCRLAAPFRLLDRVRDGGHPGPTNHLKVAESYWARFVELGYLDELGTHLSGCEAEISK